MLGRLILLFLLTPAIELGLLIQVDQLIGFGPTIGLIIATGVAGSYLARREGLATWRHLNKRLSAGELPGTELADGVIILVAGALLITPGVLTDVIGFLGLLPPSRALIRKALMKRLQSKMEDGSMQVQFGAFGGAASPPPGPSPSDPFEDGTNGSPEPTSEQQSSDWNGAARQIPTHRTPRSETSSDSKESNNPDAS
jgi:UPF0716 protein FxsA